MSTFEKPQIIVHIQKGLNYTVFDCKWVPCSAKFVTMGNFARGTGVIQVYEIQRGDLKLLREVGAGVDGCWGRACVFWGLQYSAPASLQQDQKEGDYRLRNTSGLKLCPPSQNLTGELVPWLTASPFSLHPRCNPLQGFWEVKLRFQGYIRGPFRVFAVLLVRRCNTRTCRAVRRP